jgi:hypothetical protein
MTATGLKSTLEHLALLVKLALLELLAQLVQLVQRALLELRVFLA